MISTLHIQNLALIEDLSLEFHPGLNIVTGETGAGKSVIIGAVQLLLGQRADRSLIRTGAERCELAAVLDLADTGPLLATVDAMLTDAGLPACEDGQLLLSRILTARSIRNYVNSRPVALQVLATLGDLLVDVHGPYDHQSLLRPARQLAVLDAYAGAAAELSAYRAAWQVQRERQRALDACRADTPSPETVDVLRSQLTEITKAKLSVDEEAEVTERHARAANSQQLAELIGAARNLLSEGDDALLDHAIGLHRTLDALRRVDPERGEAFADLLDSAMTDLRTLDGDLETYASRLDLDPRSFDKLEARIGLYQRLKRRYGGTVEGVLAYAAEADAKLKRLDNHADDLAKLQAEIDAGLVELRRLAADLSRTRKKQAAALAKAVVGKLHKLGFPKAGFGIALAPAELGPTGADAVEFLFCPNPGEPEHPLRAIASSGEISRVMLALKTVLAEADDVPVLIFDEVDSNIGGLVARRVGAELRALGRGRQVLCITHQPQVAAGADRHFRVDKHVEGDRTRTVLDVLEGTTRLQEIARMLGGEADSEAAIDHARDLVEAANHLD